MFNFLALIIIILHVEAIETYVCWIYTIVFSVFNFKFVYKFHYSFFCVDCCVFDFTFISKLLFSFISHSFKRISNKCCICLSQITHTIFITVYKLMPILLLIILIKVIKNRWYLLIFLSTSWCYLRCLRPAILKTISHCCVHEIL